MKKRMDVSTHSFIRFHKHNGWYRQYFMKRFYSSYIKLDIGKKMSACRNNSGVFSELPLDFQILTANFWCSLGSLNSSKQTSYCPKQLEGTGTEVMTRYSTNSILFIYLKNDMSLTKSGCGISCNSFIVIKISFL